MHVCFPFIILSFYLETGSPALTPCPFQFQFRIHNPRGPKKPVVVNNMLIFNSNWQHSFQTLIYQTYSWSKTTESSSSNSLGVTFGTFNFKFANTSAKSVTNIRLIPSGILVACLAKLDAKGSGEAVKSVSRYKGREF